MKTYSAISAAIEHRWYLVDAAGQNLGRLSTTIATYLLGKHKPYYTPHLDCGDNIVVINAARIAVTGQKLTDKLYWRHSGYPGGIKSRSLAEQLERDPVKVIEHSVRGMLPKNKLAETLLKRLKVYATAEHPHTAQSPEKLLHPAPSTLKRPEEATSG